jgi:thiamine biosynthesis lipoprotein
MRLIVLATAAAVLLPLAASLSAGCHEQPSTPAPIPSTHELAPEPAVHGDAAAPAAPPAAPFEARKVGGEGKAMGTHLTFAAYTTPSLDEAALHRAFDAAIAEIERIEALMTTWRPDAELSRVNAAAGKSPVAVSPETFDVVREALHASEISGGAFDITFESLHGLWKFDQDLDPHPPTEAQIRAKLPAVGFRHVRLDPSARTIFLDREGTKISLGGIAKGYAVDKAAGVLASLGLQSFIVQAGGDLFTAGKKPDGSEWAAGIRDPRGPGYFAMLPVSDHAFSTAGDYERSYIVGGVRYHHIIDPKTGRPATGTRSVTIWAPTALLADEIDDAVFVLGPERGLALVESLDGVGAVIVDAKNNVHVSKRLMGKVTFTAVPTDGP